MKQKSLSNLILLAYALMMIVSLVSAVDLFKISHPFFIFGWIMSIAIEISIATLLMINRASPNIKSAIYVLGFITLFQICANTYSAYIHIDNIAPFAELFAIDDWEVIDQKRVLAFATGGVLPAICLALIYIQNEVRTVSENGEHKIDDTNSTDEPELTKPSEQSKSEDTSNNNEAVETEEAEIEHADEEISKELDAEDIDNEAYDDSHIDETNSPDIEKDEASIVDDNKLPSEPVISEVISEQDEQSSDNEPLEVIAPEVKEEANEQQTAAETPKKKRTYKKKASTKSKKKTKSKAKNTSKNTSKSKKAQESIAVEPMTDVNNKEIIDENTSKVESNAAFAQVMNDNTIDETTRNAQNVINTMNNFTSIF